MTYNATNSNKALCKICSTAFSGPVGNHTESNARSLCGPEVTRQIKHTWEVNRGGGLHSW